LKGNALFSKQIARLQLDSAGRSRHTPLDSEGALRGRSPLNAAGSMLGIDWTAYRLERRCSVTPAMEADLMDRVLTFERHRNDYGDGRRETGTARSVQEEACMTSQNPCMKVRLIKPDGKTAFTMDFDTSARAEARYGRLVEACVKDLWLGARIQCLDVNGNVVHEYRISN
jgi:hypothetical protein